MLPATDKQSLSRNLITEMSLWAGVFGILTGVIGCLAVKYNKMHYICSFSCLALFIGVLLITAGSLNIQYGEQVDNTYTELCVNKRAEVEEIRWLRTQSID